MLAGVLHGELFDVFNILVHIVTGFVVTGFVVILFLTDTTEERTRVNISGELNQHISCDKRTT